MGYLYPIMVYDLKQTVHASCRALLRPIALVLLKCGMTWREFADLSKSVFVDVASTEFGLRGRLTNISRASILTGISRKEIKRQRELRSTLKTVTSSKTTDATRLLSGWHQDPDFVSDDGSPRPLKPRGASASFEQLFERYGGDTPMQTLEKELIGARSIVIDDKQRYIAARRYHMPAEMDAGNLRFFGVNLHDHARTLSRNLSDDPKAPRLEGFAVDDRIRADAVDEFTAFVDSKGQQLLEEIDEWLKDHRVDPADPKSKTVRLGIGVYAIEGSLPEGTLS